jgi:hypothetical protein
MTAQDRRNTVRLKGRTPRRMDWELFDSLPTELKRLYQDTFINCTPRREFFSLYDMRMKSHREYLVGVVAMDMERMRKQSTREVYGPDHPQA